VNHVTTNVPLVTEMLLNVTLVLLTDLKDQFVIVLKDIIILKDNPPVHLVTRDVSLVLTILTSKMVDIVNFVLQKP
jgi:hypothetical protein